MKAELKFKRTDNNQTPEVVTYHTDTIDVSGDDLRKLIQSSKRRRQEGCLDFKNESNV